MSSISDCAPGAVSPSVSQILDRLGVSSKGLALDKSLYIMIEGDPYWPFPFFFKARKEREKVEQRLDAEP